MRIIPALVLALALFTVRNGFAGGTCAEPDLLPQVTSFDDVTAVDGLSGPSIAHGNDGYAFAARSRLDGGLPGRVLFYRMDEAGTVTGPPTEVGPQLPPYFSASPVVVWDGTGYALAWYDLARHSVLFMQVTAGGSQVGTFLEFPASPPNGIDSPGLIWTGLEYALLWIGEGSPSAIFLQRIAPDGTLPFPVRTVRTGFMQQIRFARGDHGYGLVWIEDYDGDPVSSEQRANFLALGDDGTPAGPESLSSRPESVAGSPPAVTWTGDRYAVAWSYYPGVRLGFFGEDGALQGPIVMAWNSMGRDVWSKRLAWTGSDLMLAWAKPFGDQEIHALRFSHDGSPLGGEIRLTRGTPGAFVGSLLWTGDKFALAWSTGYDAFNRGRFGFIGCDCPDADGDDFSTCRSDCDDTRSGMHPGANEFCNGRDDDCDGVIDETLAVPVTCGTGACQRTVIACTDGVPAVCSPGPPSPEICNGIDDDCDLQVDDADADGDGWFDCGQDCAPANASIHPGAIEACNGLDDDCNGMADDRNGALDSDGDGVPGACDNCPAVPNPGQEDQDHDGVGNVCDNCPAVANPSQADTDGDGTADACDLCPLSPYPTTDVDQDGLGAACDNCPNVANPGQEDSDFDHVGDACDRCPGLATSNNDDTDRDTLGDPCDNCRFNPNFDQTDLDHDGEGDACDLNDGLPMIWVSAAEQVDWDPEPTFFLFDVYRGDIDWLRATGESTQDPVVVPLAGQFCGLTDSFLLDEPPPAGKAVFYLVAVTTSSGYEGIGNDSAGHPRNNAHPCP
ncbi:MAG TPA: MopE-related protein [Verrucomicrobiae bacterium]|nr:MopE-related protein [Verrucomicrobiae bacterium]